MSMLLVEGRRGNLEVLPFLFFLVSSREFLVWKALRPRDQSCIGSMFRIRSRFLLYLRHSVNSAREGLLKGELVLARLSRSF